LLRRDEPARESADGRRAHESTTASNTQNGALPPNFSPYVPPTSPEGLIYYSRKSGNPDLDTTAKPDLDKLEK